MNFSRLSSVNVDGAAITLLQAKSEHNFPTKTKQIICEYKQRTRRLFVSINNELDASA
jgi:hypothetical protein